LFKLALPLLAGKRDESYQNMQAEKLEVAVAKTTAVEQLDFEVDALREAIIDAVHKVVQDWVQPVSQGANKLLVCFERGCLLSPGSPIALTVFGPPLLEWMG